MMTSDTNRLEHEVYVCGWSQGDGGFELWVAARPHIRGYGSTYTEAEQALLKAIMDVGGAMHAVLELDPPLPHTEFERKYSSPALFIITGDDRFEIDEPVRKPFETDAQRLTRELWYDQFFTLPCCRSCRLPQAPRNQRQLKLTGFRSNYDGGFVMLAGAMLSIFSEQFLELLSTDERQRFKFLPVMGKRKTSRQYFELAGPSGPPMVAVTGLSMSGWKCHTCGGKRFGYWQEGVAIHDFVAHCDLINPTTELFTVGVEPNVLLCVTAQRWATMVGKPGTRGITSRPLGVVTDREIVRDPKLKTLQEHQ